MEDLITKKQMRTILSSLKDYVDTNKEENLINIKQTTLYSGNDPITSASNKEYTLSDNSDNYDYLICKITALQAGNNRKNSTQIIISKPYIYNSLEVNYEFSCKTQGRLSTEYDSQGWVHITSSNKIEIGLREIGSNLSCVFIESVIGIKLTKNLDNATSLDETILYSGNDYINDKTGFREYTLADMADNYDYLLVRSSAVSINGGNVISTYTIISPPFIDKVNEMIPFNFWYESQDAYNSSVQNSYYFSGWFRLDGTKLLQVGLRGLGSRVNNFYVEKVIGIKKKSLSTADIAEMAMPSDVYVNLNRGTASSVSFNYTAPANGWICWMDNPYSSNSFMRIECMHNDIYKAGNTHHGNLNTDCIVTCPITKGDTARFYGVGLTYNAYSTIRFFYSVGDAKALGLI